MAESGAPSSYHLGRPHYTVKPYQVNGVWYYPRVDYAYDASGTASWYGPGFDRRATADGEIYDMNGLSAAHKTLPLPSVVEVTNLRNGRELTLRVNDRGPFIGDRLIDVSRRAAQLLGFERSGTAPVRVRILKDASIQVAQAAMHGEFGGTAYAEAVPAAAAATEIADAAPREPRPVRLASAVPPSLRATEVIAAPIPARVEPAQPSPPVDSGPADARIDPTPPAEPQAPSLSPTRLAAVAPPVASAPALPAAPPPRRVVAAQRRHFWPSLIAEARADTLPHRIALSSRHAAKPVRPLPASVRVAEQKSLMAAMAHQSAGIFVQAGAFAVAANAERVRARIAVLGRTQIVHARIKGADLYRVRLGPVTGEAEAHRLLQRVIARGYPDARVMHQ